MNSPAQTLQASPDYYVRALALWPRLEPPRLEHVRHDPNLMAVRISRRTTLSMEAILALLVDCHNEAESPADGR
jgi:hypothetical protein